MKWGGQKDMFHPFCLLLFIFSALIHIMLIFLFMSQLQSYPPTDVSTLLKLAYQLRDNDRLKAKRLEASSTLKPLQFLQELQTSSKAYFDAVVAAAVDKSDNVIPTVQNILIPNVTSAVNRFVQNTGSTVKKILNRNDVLVDVSKSNEERNNIMLGPVIK